MKSKRIAKILGIGLSVGLVFALLGAVFAAPVAADQMKWTTVNTPDWGDLVIDPGTDILDYDIGGDGDIIFAILEVGCGRNPTFDDSCTQKMPNYALVKSDDGGVTWTDITANLFGATSIPDCATEAFRNLFCVSVSQDDEDWLAVVGMTNLNHIWAVASQDGGDHFTFAGEVKDPTGDTLVKAFDLDVSMEVDGIHNIAVAGIDNNADSGPSTGAVFRLKAGTWLTGSWEDTGKYVAAGPPEITDYLGWDTSVEAVVACEFSPLFDMDDTIVCLGCNDVQTDAGNAVIQSGMWEASSGAWNDEAGFPASKIIDADGEDIWTISYDRAMGLALPDDYDGTDPGARSVFLFVNGLMDPSWVVGGWVIRSDNYALSPVCGPPGDPILASMDVHGDADTGKLMIGELFGWDDSVGSYGAPIDVFYNKAVYCGGVSVWHTEELDFCCPQWDGCCKDPSGPYMALVMYTPDGEKEYASTSGTFSLEEDGGAYLYGDLVDMYGDSYFKYAIGTPLDESAFSVSRDDAVSFNQIGLIDTDIDWLSDVAVCPDCGTIYLSTINDGCEYCVSCGCVGDTFAPGSVSRSYSNCDSVWRSYDDGDTWERVNHGEWTDSEYQQLLLRLPCDAIEDCCDQDPVSPSGTVYLAIQESDELYYSRDCGQCWNNPPSTKENIQDVAVESENIVYVLDEDGGVSKSTQYGRRWSTPVDTKVGSGHTIAACCEEGFVVVGGNEGGKVAWSDDGGETFTRTDALPSTITSFVHVACDPVCENIIYAAVEGGGIFRTDVTDGSWDTISVLMMDYTGIVLAREGTLYAAFDNIYEDPSAGLCDSDRFAISSDSAHTVCLSGAARNLTPCETACCGTEDWDYLVCGLSNQPAAAEGGEDFDKQPSSLRICGCLSADTNSVLYAIDNWDRYEMSADCVSGTASDPYPDGALWSYEDCAAKKGPTLTAPADGAVLDCEACAGCGASPFTLKWERMCLACSYDIQIMDEDGNLIVEWVDKTITGDPPKLYVDSGEMAMVETDGGDITIYFPSDDGLLECGNTYTWKVREANTSCECVHSPWSETWSFTVAVGTADAIKLLSPVEGALGVPIANIGFSWTSVPDASSYSFVLSPNAALTGALVSQDLSSTAFNFVGPLDYDKAYYWQIKAWKDGTLLTTSAIGVFNTGSEPEAPTPPVVIEQTPAPVLEIPPAEHITPTWIYAIIGIGAALAVVVIVLIVRTRRP